jgi:hypothetical protein
MLYAIGGITLTALMWGLFCAILGAAWMENRIDKEAHEKKVERLREIGRHRASKPRATPGVPPRSGYRDSLLAPASAPPWPVPSPAQQGHANAASIDVVHLPPPAPAPDLRGAADTGWLTELSDTGAFRAITDRGDQMVAAIETGTL